MHAPIEPGVAALHALATTGPDCDYVIWEELATVDPAVLRLDGELTLVLPKPRLPAAPSAPPATSTWLKPTAGTLTLAREGSAAGYRHWGSVEPHLQIAAGGFLDAWRRWQAEAAEARSRHALWEALSEAAAWRDGRSGRTLWLRLQGTTRDGTAVDVLAQVALSRVRGDTTATLRPYAIARDALAAPEPSKHPRRIALRDLFDGWHAVEWARVGLVGGQPAEGAPRALLLGLTLQWAPRSAADLPPPLVQLGMPSAAASSAWTFLEAADPTEVVADLLLRRVMAGEKVRCVVPDDGALAGLRRRTSSWLPAECVGDGRTDGGAPRPKVVLREVRAIESRLADLRSRAGRRRDRLSVGPFGGEPGAADRMAEASDGLREPACPDLAGMDWCWPAPVSAEQAAGLRAWLVGEDRCDDGEDLPTAAMLPEPADMARLAARLEGCGLTAMRSELIASAPADMVALDAAARCFAEHASGLATTDGEDSLNGAVARLVESPDAGVGTFLAEAEAALARLEGLARVGRCAAVRLPTDVSSDRILAIACRRHARLASPARSRLLLPSWPDLLDEALLMTVLVDGTPPTTTAALRTLIETLEFERRWQDSPLPALLNRWSDRLSLPRGVTQPALVLLLCAAVNGRQRLASAKASLARLARAAGIERIADCSRRDWSTLVAIVESLLAEPDAWQRAHSAYVAFAASPENPLAQAVADAVLRLDVPALERLRVELERHHERRGRRREARAVLSDIEAAAPRWARALRARAPGALVILDDIDRQWPIARLRAWMKSDEARALAADADEERQLAQRHHDSLRRLARAQLHARLAGTPAASRPRIDVAWRHRKVAEMLSDFGDATLIYLVGDRFAEPLYALAAGCKHVMVVGTRLSELPDVGRGPHCVSALRDAVGITTMAAAGDDAPPARTPERRVAEGVVGDGHAGG